MDSGLPTSNRAFAKELANDLIEKSGESDELQSQGRRNDHSPLLSGRTSATDTPADTLPCSLALRERRIVRVALPSARVAAQLAVGNSAVTVPNDILSRKLMASAALCHVRSDSGRRADDAHVIQVHASPALADLLKSCRGRQRPAAGLVQSPTSSPRRAPSNPEAASARIAMDRLAAVGRDPHSHAPMLRRCQPYAR